MKKPESSDEADRAVARTPILAEGPITRIEIVPGGMGRMTVGPLALDVQTSLVRELRETLTRGLEKLAAQDRPEAGHHGGACTSPGSEGEPN